MLIERPVIVYHIEAVSHLSICTDIYHLLAMAIIFKAIYAIFVYLLESKKRVKVVEIEGTEIIIAFAYILSVQPCLSK